ncbi:MAG TPA: hypothetical protein VJ884_03410 [Salinibacter sp.]|nr:hypothetical protein [Salinibacter sp.]
MTDQDRTAQRTTLLIVFAMTFTTVGLSIGTANTYGLLSWAFLGLGIVLSCIAAVYAIRKDDTLGEQDA